MRVSELTRLYSAKRVGNGRLFSKLKLTVTKLLAGAILQPVTFFSTKMLML
jgi:hypothetical protein